MREREPLAVVSEPVLPSIKAVRSLAWNRKMLPLVQARLERAESVIRAHLLLNGNDGLRVGPYHISMNGDEEIVVTRQETGDWHQLSLTESKPSSVNPLNDAIETYRLQKDITIYSKEDGAA